ncbi:outer membrane beta-barrel protein [Sediminibacterium sp.]|uniref:outer membrane beta-barrel protein n=1 Tax=Sediminibacterium sp. TaxID=1917865 RepID=UPI003F6F1A9C
MKKINFILILFFWINCLNSVTGQGNHIITGTIVDEDSIPVSLATISIYPKKDSLKLISLQTDGKGKFKYIFPAGFYHLTVTHLNYYPYSEDIEINRSRDILIIVKNIISKLPDVVVKAEDKLITQKADRLIYNVEKAIHLSGSTLWEVLKKVPTVRIDFRNRISVNGQGAMVMIDDRMIRLSNEELESMLQGLSSDNIISIEVIPIPPSKYDAQGGALINIVTKKKLAEGIKGTIRSGFSQAEFSKWNIGTDLYIKKKKLQTSTSLTLRGGKAFADITDYIDYLGTSNQLISKWNISNIRTRETLMPSVRVDGTFEIDSLKSLTFSMLSTYNNIIEGSRVSNTLVSNSQLILDSTMRSINSSNGFEATNNITLGYNQKSNSNGGVISGEIDYLNFNNQPNQLLNNRVFDKAGIQINESQLKQYSIQKIGLLSGKLDVFQPLKNGSTLEYGLKLVTIKTNNNLQSFIFNAGLFEPDVLRSNEFTYTERIAAGYISFSKSYKNFGLKGGFRIEQTNTNGVSSTLSAVNRNSYINIFPSLFMNYRAGQDLNINFAFSRRIERPSFWRLNPFEYFVTPYTSMKGNPYLRPAYPLQLQLSLLYKQRTSLSFFYFNTANFFTNITNQSNDSKTLQDIQVNLNRSISYGFNLLTPITVVKDFYTVDALLQGQFQDESSSYLDSSFRNRNFNLYSSITNRLVLSKQKDIRAEFTFWHTSPTVQGIFSVKGQSDLSASLRFPILKRNGTLAFSFGDIFRTQRYIIDVNYRNQRNGFIERRDTKFGAVSVIYRFGNKRTFKPKSKKDSGIEDETRRLKS